MKEDIHNLPNSPTSVILGFQKNSIGINEAYESVVERDKLELLIDETNNNNDEIKTPPSRNTNTFLFLSMTFLRILQVLFILSWILLLLSHSARYVLDTYIQKVLADTDQDKVIEEGDGYDLEGWENRDDLTYYPRHCDQNDVTAYTFDDIQGEDTTEIIMEHGVAGIPQILSRETSTRLRNLLIEKNEKKSDDEEFQLHEPDNRWSFRIDPNDSKSDSEGVLKGALKDIAEHDVLKKTLKDVLGPDPGVMEIAVIASQPGAIDQPWHGDVWVDGSNGGYARSFTALYSLFIYLQDTSTEMGTTGFYTGSHYCSYINEDAKYQQFGVDSGGGFLFNSQMNHRGSANNDYDNDDGTRVMLVLTFAPRPRPRTDPRFLALGSVYGIPWYLNGHNLSSLLNLDAVKWNALHALGILKGGKHWGWSYPWTSLAAYVEYAAGGMLGPEWWYEREYLTKYVQFFTKASIVCYLLTMMLRFSTRKAARNHRHIFTSSFSLLSIQEIIIIGSLILLFTIDYIFSKTDLAQSILEGRRFSRMPFKSISSLNVTQNYLQSVTLPKVNDILFGDRLDAYYLYESAYFYDYHPGNKFLRCIIKNDIVDAEEYYQIPDTMKGQYIQSQVINYLDDDTQFLQQNENGHWFIVEDQKIIYEKIQLEILTSSNNLYKVLLKEIDFIFSQCKYGNGDRGFSTARINIDTAMMKIHTPILMQNLRRRLFPGSTWNVSNDQHSSKPKVPSKEIFFYPKKIMPEITSSQTRINLRNKCNVPSYTMIHPDDDQDSFIINEDLRKNLEKFSVTQKFSTDSAPNTVESIQNSIDHVNTFNEYITKALLLMQKGEDGDETTTTLTRNDFNEALNVINQCKNVDHYCSYWAAFNFCNDKQYEEFLWKHCKPSCNWCHYIESEYFDFDDFAINTEEE